VEFLGKEFEVRSLPTDRFIGVDINRNRHLGTIHLSQPEYVQKILERFNMSNCNPLVVPADPCVKLSPQMSPQNEEEKKEMTCWKWNGLPTDGCNIQLNYLTQLYIFKGPDRWPRCHPLDCAISLCPFPPPLVLM
jgi:hypothetical protein